MAVSRQRRAATLSFHPAKHRRTGDKARSAKKGPHIPRDVVDTELQFGGAGENSTRHRVRNNLPGTPEFCPLVFKTAKLNEFIAQDWKERARGSSAQFRRTCSRASPPSYC